MPTDPFLSYLASVEGKLASGVAKEHAYRGSLETLLAALGRGLTIINEPKRIACGAPDLSIAKLTNYGSFSVGHIEAKDIGKLTPDIEKTEQMKRYLGYLPNLVLTDYLEFRWYTDGSRRQVARLAELGSGNKLTRTKDGLLEVQGLLENFLAHRMEPVTNPRDLSERMARLAHRIRDIIAGAFNEGQASPLLIGWRKAFAEVLIADLDQPHKTGEFADMFAQTLAYGLFSARIMDPTPADFSRHEAQQLIPKTNPFLRDFFEAISGNRLDDEPYAHDVDDLTALLGQTDMDQVLAGFGKRTGREDPVLHFYETFLAAYDPKLRESRGVYYTPEPVVQYIVRSVDHLLQGRFGSYGGLMDNSKSIRGSNGPSQTSKTKSAKTESHRVLVLDPAVGTGTFLYAVIDLIRRRFMHHNNAGMWSEYVRDHLLPRLFGFEVLMAPYAVAHFKLGLQLAGRDLPAEQRAEWAYDFSSGERVGVYLTNTLEGAHEYTGLPLFTQFLSDETEAANSIKRDRPIMVVMGNPPYSGHSANKGEWIRDLVEDYKRKYPELYKPAQAKWLQDDYVKFIRFAQWRIERSGAGILAFISNNGYLDNPTFRGMRESLMSTFTDIDILNLHGSSKKREVTPDGSTDQNVFDIQQGVCIGIFIREPGKPLPGRVSYADLWGTRDTKYEWLMENDVTGTNWRKLFPQAPFYLFIPQNADLREEYEQYWRIPDIMNQNGDPAPGIVTTQDQFAISWSAEDAAGKVEQLLATQSEEEARKLFRLCSQEQWSYRRAKQELADESWRDELSTILYRPFDVRWTVYNSNVAVHRRERVMRHMLAGGNLALSTARSIEIGRGWEHIFCASEIIQHHTVSLKEVNYLFPLYLNPATSKQTLFEDQERSEAPGGRRPNLNPGFIADVAEKLGMIFVPDGKGDLSHAFGPEDVFNYMYAVFHSATYRSRYAEFLKSDFPRLPLTSNLTLFRKLCAIGEQLVGLHLMEQIGAPITSFPSTQGDLVVEKVRYTDPGQEGEKGRVWINKTQYFDGVPPQVWRFHIGGYQVAEKWLKDRKGRKLGYDDLQHYQQIISALSETVRLMNEIDAAIPSWPLA